MFSRHLLLLLATAICCVVAHPSSTLTRRTSSISVQLSDAGTGNVKAIVTNTGDDAVRLFTGGTVLDDLPVRKVNVYQNDKLATFTGIVAAHNIVGLNENAFVLLSPGESTENTFNLADSWDLAEGDYAVESVDAIPFANANSTQLTGAFEYRSNTIKLTITSADVANMKPAFKAIKARTLIQCDSPQHMSILQNALDQAVKLASNGADAAISGNSATFQEYFRTMSASTRSNVAARFRAITQEASLTADERKTTYYCQDPQNVCREGIVAYCQPSQNYIANCPIFYEMSVWPEKCDDQTQASTVLHEMTHAPGLFSPGTADHAYGHSSSTALGPEQALLNADTYALYATAVTAGC